MYRNTVAAVLIICAIAFTGCSVDDTGSGGADPEASGIADTAGIPWFQGSVEEAFALAKAERKPLFLYWGADWCPYCTELKATIFVRDEFIRLSHQFVPLDLSNGDSDVIRYADQFRIYGVPTVIVFSPAGEELTRLRGGMDMEQYASVLELTLNQVRPVTTLVAAAVAGERLDSADCQRLSSYSWEQDRGYVLGDENPSAVILTVQSACPAGDKVSRSRLAQSALSIWLAEDEAERDAELAPVHLAALEQILADPELAQANLTALAEAGDSILKLAQGEEQESLQQALLALYRPAIVDPRRDLLNRAIVLAGWADVATALLAEEESPDPQQQAWGARQADGLVATLNQYQVHAGVNRLWGVYYDLGLETKARETLALGIERSRTPFYFMSGMGYVDREAGNNPGALAWYRKAWEATSKPEDRARWGAGYVRRLVELAPADTVEIERASSSLLEDLISQEKGLQVYDKLISRMGDTLVEWSTAEPERQKVLTSLSNQMASHCAGLPPEDPALAACESFARTPDAQTAKS